MNNGEITLSELDPIGNSHHYDTTKLLKFKKQPQYMFRPTKEWKLALDDVWRWRDIFEYFPGDLKVWYSMAMDNEAGNYCSVSKEDRERLSLFFGDLLKLIDLSLAVYLIRRIYKKTKIHPSRQGMFEEAESHFLIPDDDAFKLLNLIEEELTDPLKVIGQICSRYDINYVRLELWELLESVVSYEGDLTNRLTHPWVTTIYRLALTCVEVCFTIAGGDRLIYKLD
jgi:hypothetical protein